MCPRAHSWLLCPLPPQTGPFCGTHQWRHSIGWLHRVSSSPWSWSPATPSPRPRSSG
uniref:Uncharacterized protein n=1 Tax=Arundo donax TaxID=35708 RepID=A0A0A8YST4_ARUDO